MKGKLFSILLLIEILGFTYLIWWYFWSTFYGHYETAYNDLAAFIISIAFILIIIFVVRMLFREKKKLYLLIVPFLWFLIFFDVFRSPVIFFHQQTDLSVTERIRLRENGTYDLLQIGQHFTNYETGIYICSGKSILFSKKETSSEKCTQNLFTKGSTITFRNLRHLNKCTISASDIQYSKFKLIKYGWLR